MNRAGSINPATIIIPYGEILNEPDLGHDISPQLYTKMYNAIVMVLRKISPGTKFFGKAASNAIID